MHIALTIAGSDAGGGAGIQADLKTFQRFGVYGTCAITAVTAQNTLGVTDWVPIPASMVVAQIDAVARDLRPAAVKTGMVADAAIIIAVAGALRAHALAPYVFDPVMVATSGDRLAAEGAAAAMREHLLPLARLVTPNLDEAAMLTGAGAIRDPAGMERAARALVAAGAGAALVTGGHLAGDDVVDVLFDGGAVRAFRHARLTTRHTHGTGCTLSAAITAQLAEGAALIDAVERSLDYVHRAIASAPGLGAGHGPVNHLA